MLQFDELMKNTFYEEGWAEDCKDDDLILSLYEKYKFSIEVSLTIPKTPNTRNIRQGLETTSCNDFSNIRKIIQQIFSIIMINLERLKSILFKQSCKFSQDVVYMEKFHYISDVRRLIRMFFSQNNLRGECFYPRICDVTKHSFILEFGASPELACQVKSLNGSGSLGLRVDKISLYTGWRRQYIWTDIVHTY